MKLRKSPPFDPDADLVCISEFAEAWRSQFRPAQVAYTPSHFQAQLEELRRAKSYRLYLITRPAQPIPLAIIHPLSQDDAILLMALSPVDDPDLVRPLEMSPHEKRLAMQGAPGEPSGRGVYPFLLGEPGGMALLDFEPEGLVLVMSRWAERNVLDPEPLLAERMHLLGEQIKKLARPKGDDGNN
jgi:hypothetical protein